MWGPGGVDLSCLDRHEHYVLVLQVLQIAEGEQAGGCGREVYVCLCVCVCVCVCVWACKVFQTCICRWMIGGVGWMW